MPDPSVSALDFLRGDTGDKDEPDEEEPIGVLSENWQAVAVFRRCRPNWITGMHAPVWDGIAAVEVRAAALLERVPRADYPDLLWALDILIAATRQARAE